MKQYRMALDIGNSNTVVGLFDDSSESIPHHWRTVTHRDRTSDELGIFLIGFLQSVGIGRETIESFIYSSVVPSFNPIVERMARDYFRVEPQRVSASSNLPIQISYPRPFEIGADRLVNAVAARKFYPGDLIIIDLGTATTFCVMHGNEYLGGVIAPGLKLSMESLHRKTAQLPAIEFARPQSGVIGQSTVDALRSGFFYGWIGLIRELIERIKAESPGRSYSVVATGGLASLIHQEVPELFAAIDPLLTLKGLKAIFHHQQALDR